MQFRRALEIMAIAPPMVVRMMPEQITALEQTRHLNRDHAHLLRDVGYPFERFEPAAGVYVLGEDVRLRVEADLVHFDLD